MWFNNEAPLLGDFEQLTMLAVLRLEEDAYGAAIQREIESQTGRLVSVNAIYTTLDRLEAKGLLRSWIGDPTRERGRASGTGMAMPGFTCARADRGRRRSGRPRG